MGFGPKGQNPSCLGTLLGPAAHPSLGALRALHLGLRPNKIVEEGGVCAMVLRILLATVSEIYPGQGQGVFRVFRARVLPRYEC